MRRRGGVGWSTPPIIQGGGGGLDPHRQLGIPGGEPLPPHPPLNTGRTSHTSLWEEGEREGFARATYGSRGVTTPSRHGLWLRQTTPRPGGRRAGRGTWHSPPRGHWGCWAACEGGLRAAQAHSQDLAFVSVACASVAHH